MKLALAILSIAFVAAAAAAQTPEAALPAGPGKETFEARCSTCPGVGRVLIYKRTKAQWAATVSAMQEKGLSATDLEIEQIVDYLTAALPAAPDAAPSAPSGGV